METAPAVGVNEPNPRTATAQEMAMYERDLEFIGGRDAASSKMTAPGIMD
jgi:hypothetical protein